MRRILYLFLLFTISTFSTCLCRSVSDSKSDEFCEVIPDQIDEALEKLIEESGLKILSGKSDAAEASAAEMVALFRLLKQEFFDLMKADIKYYTNWVHDEFHSSVRRELTRDDRQVLDNFFQNVTDHFQQWRQDLRNDIDNYLDENHDTVLSIYSHLLQSMRYVAAGDAGSAMSEMDDAISVFWSLLGKGYITVIAVDIVQLKAWCRQEWLSVQDQISADSQSVLQGFWSDVLYYYDELVDRLATDTGHFTESHQLEIFALLQAFIATAKNIFS